MTNNQKKENTAVKVKKKPNDCQLFLPTLSHI